MKRYNITTDETRIPHEVEAPDGYYVHASDYEELEERFKRLSRHVAAEMNQEVDIPNLYRD